MRTFEANMSRAIAYWVNKILQESGVTPASKTGTVAAGVVGNVAQVVLDGSTVAVPVRVFGGVYPAEGDRVILMRVEGKWAIVGTFLVSSNLIILGTPGAARIVLDGLANKIEVFNSANQLIGRIDQTGIATIKPGGQQIRLDPTGTYPQIIFRSADGTKEAYINAAATGAPGPSDSWIGVNTPPHLSVDGTTRTPRLWLLQDRARLEVVKSSNQAADGGYAHVRHDAMVAGHSDADTGIDNRVACVVGGIQLAIEAGTIHLFTQDVANSALVKRDNKAITVPRGWIHNVLGPVATTTSGTFVNLSTSVSFTKNWDDTYLFVELSGSTFTTVVQTSVEFAVLVNGVDRICTRFFHNSASTHHTFPTGGHPVPSLPAGAYTLQPRWRRMAGTGVLNMDANDILSLKVWEGKESVL